MRPLRIFILPSWSPTRTLPHSGIFFLRQANFLAALRPEWSVGIGLFDFTGTRMPHSPKSLLRFTKAFFSEKRFAYSHLPSGLHCYRTWHPWQRYTHPFSDAEQRVRVLVCEARGMLHAFIHAHGVPDVLHAHAATPGGAAAVRLGREFGLPVAITEHMGPFPWPRHTDAVGKPIAAIREAYAGAKGCSAASEALADRLRQLRLCEKITVLPHAVDPDIYSPQLDEKKEEMYSFLCVGGPSFPKGTDTLLYAFARLPDLCRLTLVGDSASAHMFHDMARKLGVHDRICWLERVPPEGMPALYRQCDAFVLPSRGETFGVSYVEALMCGKPVIATDCGGPADIVRPHNGKLLPVGDVDALAGAMTHVMEQGYAYDQKQIREDAIRRFGPESVVARTEAFYREFLDPEGAL